MLAPLATVVGGFKGSVVILTPVVESVGREYALAPHNVSSSPGWQGRLLTAATYAKTRSPSARPIVP